MTGEHMTRRVLPEGGRLNLDSHPTPPHPHTGEDSNNNNNVLNASGVVYGKMFYFSGEALSGGGGGVTASPLPQVR